MTTDTRDRNMYYLFRVHADEKRDATYLHRWFISHGHKVEIVQPDSVSVCMSGGKMESISSFEQSDLAGLVWEELCMTSEPVGFERGEWVVLREAGVVGKATFEFGYSDSRRTSLNVSIGDATWQTSASSVLKVNALPDNIRERVIELGEEIGSRWREIHCGRNGLQDLREEVHSLISGQC